MDITLTCQKAIDLLLSESKPVIVNNDLVDASGFDEFEFDLIGDADINVMLIEDDLINFVLFTLPEPPYEQSY